ncbi:hypothetical protein FRC01_011348, partial [Tulasnella sp. 417]
SYTSATLGRTPRRTSTTAGGIPSFAEEGDVVGALPISMASPNGRGRQASASATISGSTSRGNKRRARVSASVYEPSAAPLSGSPPSLSSSPSKLNGFARPSNGDSNELHFASEADAFRAKIEALRNEVGDSWLKVLSQSNSISPPTGGADFLQDLNNLAMNKAKADVAPSKQVKDRPKDDIRDRIDASTKTAISLLQDTQWPRQSTALAQELRQMISKSPKLEGLRKDSSKTPTERRNAMERLVSVMGDVCAKLKNASHKYGEKRDFSDMLKHPFASLNKDGCNKLLQECWNDLEKALASLPDGMNNEGDNILSCTSQIEPGTNNSSPWNHGCTGAPGQTSPYSGKL